MLNLSNPNTILYIVLGVIFIVLGSFFLFSYLENRGYNVAKFFKKSNEVIHQADDIFDTVKEIVPIPYEKLIDKIFEYGEDTTKAIEQRYQTGQISKESRKQMANDEIVNILKVLKVEITPELQRLIDVSIEKGVKILPKTNVKSDVLEERKVDEVTSQTIQDFHNLATDINKIENINKSVSSGVKFNIDNTVNVIDQTPIQETVTQVIQPIQNNSNLTNDIISKVNELNQLVGNLNK